MVRVQFAVMEWRRTSRFVGGAWWWSGLLAAVLPRRNCFIGEVRAWC